jgi:pantoate kinase
MIQTVAFSPGHITGFFEIFDTDASPLEQGSRGAGVSLSKGVKTTISIEKSAISGISIFFGDKQAHDAVVSERTIDLFLKRIKTNGIYSIRVRHEIAVPLGAGCGSSGAGALSLAIALNSAFNSGLTRLDAAQIAHVAEVESKTGLGSVIGEALGGVEVRIKPGAPGIGEIINIPIDRPYKVVSLTFGPLATKKYLQDKSLRDSIKRYGKSLVDKIILNPTIDNFMTFSREFTEKTGLLSAELAEIIEMLDKHGIKSSMPMFGNGIFSLVQEEKLGEIGDLLKKYTDTGKYLECTIDAEGARLLHENQPA